jgi:hypothetical protein
MHKGIILLTVATSREEALTNIRTFLKPYGNGIVWDWMQIGGRWNNILAPKFKQWCKKAKKILNPNNEKSFGYTDTHIKNNQVLLQAEWIKLGMIGDNSYCDHYKLSDDGNSYDIMPLTNCVDFVKTWVRNMNKVRKEAWKQMIKAKREENKLPPEQQKYGMSGYYAGLYKHASYNDFCFESNVYNITKDEGEMIPDNINDYYAVICDLHN